ncbi:MAG: T9SS type A sorting domain-containing protein [Bacteroidota bacterium]
MKNIFTQVQLVIILLLSSQMVFSQNEIQNVVEGSGIINSVNTANKGNTFKPLYQEFTSSTCIPCAGANEILDDVLMVNPGTHSLIKYQMNWPGSGDPYYTAEGGVRKDYYGISYVPDMYINSDQLAPANMTQQIYDSYQGLLSDMVITVNTAEIDSNLYIVVDVDIDVTANLAAGLTAHIVVVEKTTVGNVGTNDETEFHNVMLKMLPDAYGTPLPALSPGTTENLLYIYDMDLTFMEQPNDLAVIIFVQDDTDHSIIQSEMTDVAGEFEDYVVNFMVEDILGNPIEGAEIFLEGNGSKVTNDMGEAVYENIYPGTYAYDVNAAGYFDTIGSIEVINEEITEKVTMMTPQFYWFEMFDTEIPANWTVYATAPDHLYWYGEKVIFMKQSGSDDPTMLVSPAINVDPADTLYFDIINVSAAPTAYFGTITDPANPETFTVIDTIYPVEPFTTHKYDLSALSGDIYFAWMIDGSGITWFEFDNVILTATPTNISDYNISANIAVSIFPNPASDYVKIKSEGVMTSLSVYNYVGQQLSSEKVHNAVYTLSTSAYLPGIYLIHIETNDGVVVKRIIIK